MPTKKQLQIQQNKRKQTWLRSQGYKVKVDGSWGPWQQKLYEQATTRKKTVDDYLLGHKPSIWNMGRYFYDKATGNDTYHIDPVPDFKEASNIKFSDKSIQERDKHYWDNSLEGYAERQKSSMENETNPLVAVKNVLLPAIALPFLARALAKPIMEQGVKGLAKAAVSKVGTLAKAAVSHPKLAVNVAKGVAAPFVKGAVGSAAVNAGSYALTGDTWGGNVAPYLGTSEDVAEWTNPGMLFSGLSWNPKKGFYFKDITGIKDLKSQVKDADSRAVLNKKSADEALAQKRASDNKALKIMNEISNINSRLSYRSFRVGYPKSYLTFNSPLKQWKTRVAKYLENPEVEYYNIKAPKDINLNESSTTWKPVTGQFTYDGNIYPLQNIYYYDKNGTVIPKGEIISYDPVYDTITTETSSNGSFGTIFKGDYTNYSNGIRKYMDTVNSAIGDDGVVTGSVVHYANGTFPATIEGGKPVGPQDTEILTTKARLNSLMDKLKFKSDGGINSVGGNQGTSPITFRNPASPHGDTEINVIDEQNGHAVGQVAHQIMKALHPEEYAKFTNNLTYVKRSDTPLTEVELPYTAEQLLQELKMNGGIGRQLRSDLVGAPKEKAANRHFSMIFNENPEVQQQLAQAIYDTGASTMQGFKLGTEIFPNLKFNDIEANARFLQQYYKLSSEEAMHYAQNPQIVRNAFNDAYKHDTTLFRRTGANAITDPGRNVLIEGVKANGNFGGGSVRGAGGNRQLGRSVGDIYGDAISITQEPMTYHPEKITTLQDYLNLKQRLTGQPKELEESANLLTLDNKYDYNKIKEVAQIAKDLDTPIVYSPTENGKVGQYVGTFRDEPIAYTTSVSEKDPETGVALFDFIKRNKNSTTKTTLPEDWSSEGINPKQQYLSFLDEFSKATPVERRKLIGRTVQVGTPRYTEGIHFGGSDVIKRRRYNADASKFSSNSKGVGYLTKQIKDIDDQLNDNFASFNLEGGAERDKLLEERKALQRNLTEIFKNHKADRTQKYKDLQTGKHKERNYLTRKRNYLMKKKDEELGNSNAYYDKYKNYFHRFIDQSTISNTLNPIIQNRENVLKNVFKWGSTDLGLGAAGRYIYENSQE